MSLATGALYHLVDRARHEWMYRDESQYRFQALIRSTAFLAAADPARPTVTIGANAGTKRVTVNRKPMGTEAYCSRGSGVTTLPTYLLVGVADGCHRFLLEVLRSGFALRPFDSSGEPTARTRVFSETGRVMWEDKR